MIKYIRKLILKSFFAPQLKAIEGKKFRQQFEEFKQMSSSYPVRFPVVWENVSPCVNDGSTGQSYDRHYIYHTAWAARKLKEISPPSHVDISSSLYFSSIVSAFVPVAFYDYRPADLKLENLACGKADLLALPFRDGEIVSLSCMHVVEHIGLGRYGDPLDPQGDLKAISELVRVLSPGGNLLFVVPVGKSLLQFNSHRIYSYEQIITAFENLTLLEFSLVPDDKKLPLLNKADPAQVKNQDYGCGCFWFTKS